ncbi:hypothetical protein HZS_6507 [Henneguya salminicola]|nr:hypothetical protein HZS_6507 [Henneguya salminicola]
MFELEPEPPPNNPLPTRRLLAGCLSRSIQSVSPLISSYNSLQQNVQMIRQRINLPLTILSDAVQFIISEEYKIRYRNEKFYCTIV